MTRPALHADLPDHTPLADASPRPAPAPLAWLPLLVVAAAKLAVHLATITRFGYFRDELYYLASTEHLAWGYVDHPPLSIALLAGVRALAGDGLVATRAVPTLAGVALVLLAGIFAARLGGGRYAQGLAALAVAAAPVFLGFHHNYSMNVLDQLVWPLALLLLLALDAATPTRHWLPFGLLLGLGLLNKLSVLWLGAGLAVALVATPLRRTLARPGPWLAGAVAMLCLAPHVAWQVANDWPTREFVHNATTGKMLPLTPLQFLNEQVQMMNPAAAPLWIAALAWAFTRAGRAARPAALVFLTALAILLANPASRPSYLAPAFPALLAAGAVAFERWRGRTATAARWLLPVAMLAFAAVALPVVLPVLSPEGTAAWARRLGVEGGQERTRPAELPQHMADQFGWDEIATKVARAYQALPADDRARCAVFGQNYGEAGALDVLGRPLGLPPALSGHNAYWTWGPRGFDGSVALVLGDDRETLAGLFESVEQVDTIACRWCMPYERDLPLWLARGLRTPLPELWPGIKNFS